MSMLQELVAAVSGAERQIDDQISKLTSYKAELDGVKSRVDIALAGSSQSYNIRMIEQLATTQRQIDATIASLRNAKDKLLRVRMI